MHGRVALALLALLQLGASPAAASCAGPDPVVVSIANAGVQSNDNLNRYTLRATVRNLGHGAQPGNTLQFVDIYKGTIKMDSRGIPPLKPGASYSFTYVSTRSADSGDGTTTLEFRIRVESPATARATGCGTGTGNAEITF